MKTHETEVNAMLLSLLEQIPYTGSCGICSLSELGMGGQATENANKLCPNAQTVGVVLFPYLVRDASDRPRNISLYACGADYHSVIARALEPVCEQLRQKFPEHSFAALADSSPVPEVRAAWVSGAGILGRNGLIFDPVYGSFVFIGTILTSLPCEPSAVQRRTCPNCGACRRACPMSAIGEDGSVDCSRCLSDITQSKQELTDDQTRALAEHPLIWGCDRCSLVCPLNKDVPETPNPAFREDRLTQLTSDDVDNLTRKQFLTRYPDRAFTWRGPKPLQRNLELKAHK